MHRLISIFPCSAAGSKKKLLTLKIGSSKAFFHILLLCVNRHCSRQHNDMETVNFMT